MATSGLSTTLTFVGAGTGSGEAADIVIGSLTSIGEVGADADELEVTTLSTTGGYRKYIPGFKDAGEVALSGYLEANENQDEIITFFDSGKSLNAKIAFPSGANITFPCFVKSYKVGPAEIDSPVGFSASLRVTGSPTFSESASA